MPKEAVSVTLDAENLLWLRGRIRTSGRGSLSETLDQLISEARRTGRMQGPSRSVVGTIDIASSDPGLDTADDYIRGLFEASVQRPLMVREDAAPYGRAPKRPRKQTAKRRG